MIFTTFKGQDQTIDTKFKIAENKFKFVTLEETVDLEQV